MTIVGVCDPLVAAPACKTTVTARQFDRIIAAVNPQLPASGRRQLATFYAQLLAVSSQAVQSGLDKDPVLRERLRLERLRSLAQAMGDKIREKNRPSQQEIETYYAENRDRFEELQMRGVVIPKAIEKESKPAETRKIAESLLARANAHEDMDKLQADAYLQTKAPGAPPATSLGWRGRGRLGPHEAELVKLKAGDNSGIFEDPQSYYIFRVDAKRLVPLADVRADIENNLMNERTERALNEAMKAVKTELDPGYFGQPEIPPAATPKQP